MVLHSFHYLYPPSYFLIKHSEKYARNIGQELEKLNLPHAVVKESPKYRNYKKLTERYDSKWVLDLHSNDAKIKYPKWYKELKRMGKLVKGPKYLSMLFFGGELPHTEEIYPDYVHTVAKWLKKKYPKEYFDFDMATRKRPENYIGVELFHHNPKSKSVEFVKNLIEFLYLN